MERNTLFEKGDVFREEVDTSVISLVTGGQFEPKDFWFNLNLPKMSHVQVEGTDAFSYLWDGEWAKPRAELLTHVDRDSSPNRFWTILVLNLLGLLSAGGWWYFKTRKP